MTDFTRVLRRADLAAGGPATVRIGGQVIAVFDVGGSVYAVDDACPHRGGPLSEGSVEGAVLTCPWHGWKFELETGACRTAAGSPVRRYPVKVEGDDVLVGI